MKKSFALVLVALAACLSLHAQAAPRKVLNQKDLERFLADLKRIEKDDESAPDFSFASEEESDEEMDFSVAGMKRNFDKLKKDPAARAVVAKYKWDDRFWDYLYAIYAGYTSIAMDEMPQEYMTAETLAYRKDLKATVHADDLALLRKNRALVEASFSE